MNRLAPTLIVLTAVLGCDDVTDQSLDLSLRLHEVVPQAVPSRGGTSVRLVGRGFDQTTTVRVDGEIVAHDFVSEALLIIAAPVLPIGEYSVEVSNPRQQKDDHPMRVYAGSVRFVAQGAPGVVLEDVSLRQELHADLTGDGRADIIARASDLTSFTVFASRGADSFERTYTANVSRTGDGANIRAPIDVDGDGHLDIVADDRVVHYGDGEGAFTPGAALPSASRRARLDFVRAIQGPSGEHRVVLVRRFVPAPPDRHEIVIGTAERSGFTAESSIELAGMTRLRVTKFQGEPVVIGLSSSRRLTISSLQGDVVWEGSTVEELGVRMLEVADDTMLVLGGSSTYTLSPDVTNGIVETAPFYEWAELSQSAFVAARTPNGVYIMQRSDQRCPEFFWVDLPPRLRTLEEIPSPCEPSRFSSSVGDFNGDGVLDSVESIVGQRARIWFSTIDPDSDGMEGNADAYQRPFAPQPGARGGHHAFPRSGGVDTHVIVDGDGVWSTSNHERSELILGWTSPRTVFQAIRVDWNGDGHDGLAIIAGDDSELYALPIIGTELGFTRGDPIALPSGALTYRPMRVGAVFAGNGQQALVDLENATVVLQISGGEGRAVNLNLRAAGLFDSDGDGILEILVGKQLSGLNEVGELHLARELKQDLTYFTVYDEAQRVHALYGSNGSSETTEFGPDATTVIRKFTNDPNVLSHWGTAHLRDDFDGDGNSDLLVRRQSANLVRGVEGSEPIAVEAITHVYFTGWLRSRDWNGDGLPDLIEASVAGGTPNVLLNIAE